MYKIERAAYGYKLTFGDTISLEEMGNWVEEAKQALTTAPASFGVMVDMRTLKPITPDAQQKMQEGQKAFKERGMERSAVALASALVTMQFKKIAQESGIYAWERYVDAGSNANWEADGVAWVRDGVDPDA